MSGLKLWAVGGLLVGLGSGGCDPQDLAERRRPQEITIADLTGMNPNKAVDLIDHLDLVIEVEEIDVTTLDPAELPSGALPTGRFPMDVVVFQVPSPGTVVEAGSALTLFVPEPRPIREGEKPFTLLTHCGLGYPMRFDDRLWLPVERRWRRTINAPRGFGSNGFSDRGTIRRLDEDSVVYTSSSGIEVEYEPTDQVPGGCD